MFTNRRVVVTGIGLVTPVGLNVQDSWKSILECCSGVKRITHFDASKLQCKIAASVDNFDPEQHLSKSDIKKMDRFIHFGIIAASEAIEDSGWMPNEDEQDKLDRTGVMIGSGIGGLNMIESTSIAFNNSTKNNVSPFFIPASLINLTSGHVAIKYKFTGPNSAVVTACSTGAHSIGDAARMIQYGSADVMIAGGAEAPISPVGVAGFASARTLTTKFNDNPEKASRPWDVDRSGFVMGEGAGVLVLEEYEHAKERNAKIYGELVGYGLTCDASHITTPNGRGAYRAMNNALEDAGVRPFDVDYINAHGTSTIIGDETELEQVEKLFQGHNSLCMSSTKSSIGHLLGATGSVEAIFSLLAMRDNIAPPTLNLETPMRDSFIDLVAQKPKKHEMNYVLSNSFGFGGTNASLLFKKYI